MRTPNLILGALVVTATVAVGAGVLSGATPAVAAPGNSVRLAATSATSVAAASPDTPDLADDLSALGLRVTALEDAADEHAQWKEHVDQSLDNLSGRIGSVEISQKARDRAIDSIDERLSAQESTARDNKKALSSLAADVKKNDAEISGLQSKLAELSSDTGYITSELNITSDFRFTVRGYSIRVRGDRLTGWVRATYTGPTFAVGSNGNFTDINGAVVMPTHYRPSQQTQIMITRNGIQQFFGRVQAGNGSVDFTHGIPGVSVESGVDYYFTLDYYVDSPPPAVDPGGGSGTSGVNAHTDVISYTLKCDATTDFSLPLGGMDGKVIWGDGPTANASGDSPKRKLSAGKQYTVAFYGTYEDMQSASSDSRSCVRSVDGWDSTKTAIDGGSAFYAMANLTDVPASVPALSNTMWMFLGAKSFNDADVSHWDMSKVTDMNRMFSYSAFNKPIGNWDTSRVTNMSMMFNSNSAFNQPIGNWDTSRVTNMSYMFSDASAFNRPIGGWDTSKVVDMNYMFSGASKFSQDLSDWDVAKASRLHQTVGFADDSALTAKQLPRF